MDKQRKKIKDLLDEANAALLQGQYPLAATIADAILTKKPNYPQGFSIKFKALVLNKEYEEARSIGVQAAVLNPTSEYILNNQACLDLGAGQPVSAIKLLTSLLEQYGEQPSWLFNLGLAHRRNGQSHYAVDVFQRVLDCKPDHDKAVFQLVECLLENGQLEEAVIMQNYLRLLRSSDASTHSQFINLAIKTGELSPSQLEQEATLWNQRFIPRGQSYAIKALNNPNTATMGFLLGELPSPWLDQIITPLINALAENGDKIFVYTTKHNSSSNRFNSAVTHVSSNALSDDGFVAHVRRNGIEILVDVCGFNIGQRQIALGLQIASKQFGWLAHPGYYASRLVEIMDEDSDSLPIFIQLNKAPADSPANLLPSNTLAAIGCKQGLSNIVMRTWVEVLKRQNNLNLQLDTSEPSIIKNLTNRFVDLGVDQERLLFTGDLQFNHETVVVDNFMQNNIIEVAQAANSGACVIALDGELFQGTLSARLLKQLGRPEWVSYDRINYVAKIIQQLNEQSRNPITVAEIKTSRLEDLDGFVEQFRTILLA